MPLFSKYQCQALTKHAQKQFCCGFFCFCHAGIDTSCLQRRQVRVCPFPEELTATQWSKVVALVRSDGLTELDLAAVMSLLLASLWLAASSRAALMVSMVSLPLM